MLLRRVLFHQLLHDLDSFLELAVAALSIRRRFEIDFDVRRDAMVFDLPLAVQAVDCRPWRGDAAAVEQFRIAADADETAPRPRADERTDAGLAEVPGQRVTAGPGHLVDDHHLRPIDRF